MKPKLILHIGTPKTGTSSLQNYLEQNREFHLKECGLFYPRTARTRGGQCPRHYFLYSTAMGHLQGRPRTDAKETLIDLIAQEFAESGATTGFLSEELLCSPAHDIATFYGDLQARFDVSVLIVLRRQDLFIESLYNQMVRSNAETRSVKEFIDAPDIHPWTDYYAIIQRWSSVFGDDAIRVLKFDSKQNAARLIWQVFKTFSLKLPSIPDIPRVNVSPSREIVETLRTVNNSPRLRALPADRGRKIRKQLVRLFKGLHQGPQNTRILGKEDRRRLLDECREGNDEIARRYFPEDDRELFPVDIDNEPYPEKTWQMPAPQMASLLADAIAELCVASAPEPPVGAATTPRPRAEHPPRSGRRRAG